MAAWNFSSFVHLDISAVSTSPMNYQVEHERRNSISTCTNICITCIYIFVDLSKSFGGAILHEPQPYVPSNPIHENDIERLLSVESEVMEGSWSRVKKTKDAEVWRRDSNEEGFPPITKVWILRCTLALFLSSSTISYNLTFATYSDVCKAVHVLLVKQYILP